MCTASESPLIFSNVLHLEATGEIAEALVGTRIHCWHRLLDHERLFFLLFVVWCSSVRYKRLSDEFNVQLERPGQPEQPEQPDQLEQPEQLERLLDHVVYYRCKC
jgi:hypothetical protein